MGIQMEILNSQLNIEASVSGVGSYSGPRESVWELSADKVFQAIRLRKK